MSDRPKPKLFEFAAIYHPPVKRATKDDDGEYQRPKSIVIVDVTRVLATDEKAAVMLAARAIPAEYADKLDDVEICVRPF